MLSHLKKESMHHAFVIEGDIKQSRATLFDFLKNEFGMGLGHNDLILLDRGDFGVENVQEIVDVNSRKPTVGMYKIIVVVLNSISHQAQNAILKTLEEPRPGTFIFILANTASIFLPTILSRVQVVRGFAGVSKDALINSADSADSINSTDSTGGSSSTGSSSDTKQSKKDGKKIETLDVQIFIKNSSSERLSQIKEILDLKSDEEIGDGEIFAFIQGVEKNACEFAQKSKDASLNTLVAQIFTKVEDYMRDTSSSKKLLLEYVALRLPNF